MMMISFFSVSCTQSAQPSWVYETKENKSQRSNSSSHFAFYYKITNDFLLLPCLRKENLLFPPSSWSSVLSQLSFFHGHPAIRISINENQNQMGTKNEKWVVYRVCIAQRGRLGALLVVQPDSSWGKRPAIPLLHALLCNSLLLKELPSAAIVNAGERMANGGHFSKKDGTTKQEMYLILGFTSLTQPTHLSSSGVAPNPAGHIGTFCLNYTSRKVLQ